MKAFKVRYHHGHFIDLDTNQRIIPVQGHEFILTANPEAFTTQDTKLQIGIALNSKEKAAWAKKEFVLTKYQKLFDAGTQFIFRIGNRKKVDGDEDSQYVFLCSLMEDLYMYQMKGKDASKEKNWRLANCNCQLEKCLLGGMVLHERLLAESLNQLFAATVMHYFSNQRSTACNAFKDFYMYNPNKPVMMYMVLSDMYESLDDKRTSLVSNSS